MGKRIVITPNRLAIYLQAGFIPLVLMLGFAGVPRTALVIAFAAHTAISICDIGEANPLTLCMGFIWILFIGFYGLPPALLWIATCSMALTVVHMWIQSQGVP